MGKFYDDIDMDELEINKKRTECIILVAREFRKEVTFTVLWRREDGMHLQCIKVMPYKLETELLIDVEQIIPVKELEEYTIKIQRKNNDNLEKVFGAPLG